MSEESKAPKAEEQAAKKPTRRYKWNGITPKDPKIFNQYGTAKIRPWSMTDDEIDALIKRHPDLVRLWEKK